MLNWTSRGPKLLLLAGITCALLTFQPASALASIGDDDSLIQLTDLLQLQQLGSVQYSPDGRFILFTVNAIMEQDDRQQPYAYRNRIWLVPADGSAPARALTSDRANASQPAWHPAGRHIAFTRSIDGRSQIMLLSLDGGEPQPITNHANGATSPLWSPDGSRLLFSSSMSMQDLLETDAFSAGPSWSTEQDGRTLASRNHGDVTPNPDGTLAEIRAWLDRNESDRNPRVLTRLNFQGETDLQPNLSFSHRYVVDVNVNRLPAEPAEATALTTGYVSWGGGSWSRDGRYVYLSTSADGETHPDRLFKSRLYRVATDGSREPELFLDVENYSIFNPVVSPDGRWVAFSQSDINDPSYAQTMISVVRTDKSDFRALSQPLDRSMSGVTWSGDSQFVYFTGNSNGGTVLYRGSVGGSSAVVQQLTGFTEGIRSFDLHGDRVA
ncbi:MAG: hypothetical protein LAT52_07825, partial [Balneolales bacterium]|nr:hypothetical protein [Balneolales bacterium]